MSVKYLVYSVKTRWCWKIIVWYAFYCLYQQIVLVAKVKVKLSLCFFKLRTTP